MFHVKRTKQLFTFCMLTENIREVYSAYVARFTLSICDKNKLKSIIMGEKVADIHVYKATVAQYTTNVNIAVLERMAKNYALVLSNLDSQYVSCSDENERKTIRENFLKKKLNLNNSNEDLDAAIESVCQMMQNDLFKSRLAFYYLLAEKFNKLEMFV
jgi:hypothetical protein